MSEKKSPVRRPYTITKFSRHRDGHLHCRITFDGETYYAHERFGSWMVDVERDGKTIMKEVLSPYKEELAARGRQFRKALAKRAAEERAAAARSEATVALKTGYKKSAVVKALEERFSMTNEEACGIIQQVNTQTEANSDGSKRERSHA